MAGRGLRRDGGRVTTAAVDLRQDGETRITGLATYGGLERLRDRVGTTNFVQAWGTNSNKRNAFGKCVSHMAKMQSQYVKSAQHSRKSRAPGADRGAALDAVGAGGRRGGGAGPAAGVEPSCVWGDAEPFEEQRRQLATPATHVCLVRRAVAEDIARPHLGVQGSTRRYIAVAMTAVDANRAGRMAVGQRLRLLRGEALGPNLAGVRGPYR